FKPAIDGRNISRYALCPSSEFVDFRDAAIKSGGKEFVYEQPRVGVRQIGEVPIATILPAGLYSLNTIYNIFFIKPTQYDLRFILALLSAKLMQWYWKRCFFDQKETFPKIKKDALLAVPIARLDIARSGADKDRHDRSVASVE